MKQTRQDGEGPDTSLKQIKANVGDNDGDSIGRTNQENVSPRATITCSSTYHPVTPTPCHKHQLLTRLDTDRRGRGRLSEQPSRQFPRRSSLGVLSPLSEDCHVSGLYKRRCSEAVREEGAIAQDPGHMQLKLTEENVELERDSIVGGTFVPDHDHSLARSLVCWSDLDFIVSTTALQTV